MTDTPPIVQNFLDYCNVLRDDGLSYGDCVEQLTFLLFLKMADERLRQSGGWERIVPEQYDWQSLGRLNGRELNNHYRKTLEALSEAPDERLRLIFSKAQNRVQDPAKLRWFIDLIDKENWSSMDVGIKDDIYEGLLQKNAEDPKSGAAQYFTPRPLIEAIVEVMRPGHEDTICDPACGPGGFLITAHKYIQAQDRNPLSREENPRFDKWRLRGYEILDSVARLGLMNLELHGIGGGANLPIVCKDSLENEPDEHFKMVLTDPPVGRKSGRARERFAHRRPDFWTTTNNRQLDFLQHVYSLLEIDGRAAVVIPDNVLFEGGAGKFIREKLLHTCDVHTLLRLPTGVFYTQSAKASVLFFDRKSPRESHWTERLWIYDFRANQNFTFRERPLRRRDLDDFVKCFNPENRFDRQPTWSDDNPKGRWRDYTYDQIINDKNANLDIVWIRDENLDNLDNEEPGKIASRMFENLQLAIGKISMIMDDIGKPSK
jgi:type I restriction enzyme M protein